MSDLIDRQTAQRLFGKAISFKEHVGKMMWSTSEVKEWVAEFIEDLPSASTEFSTFSDKLWKIAYERGKKEGMQQLHDYQVEWLKSHDDLQLDPQLEKMIIRFLHDTTNCLLMERGDSE